MALNGFGEIVEECWNDLPNHYGNVRLDKYVIMPDHFHGIVVLRDNVKFAESLKLNNVGNGLKPFPTQIRYHGLSEIIRGFKTFSSRNINLIIQDEYRFRWQKSFHDRVIRNELELSLIREYVVNNAAQGEDGVPRS